MHVLSKPPAVKFQGNVLCGEVIRSRERQVRSQDIFCSYSLLVSAPENYNVNLSNQNPL